MCYCTNFALFYFEFEGNLQVQAPGGLCLVFGGLINFGGACFRNFTVFQKTSRFIMIQRRTKRTQCIWKTYTTPNRTNKNQLQSKKDAKQIFSYLNFCTNFEVRGLNCLHFFFKILLVLNSSRKTFFNYLKLIAAIATWLSLLCHRFFAEHW